MTTNTELTSNLDLARLLAHVADALAYYDHLPLLGGVSVSSYNGSIRLRPSILSSNNEMRDVVVWAQAFDVPVVIDLSGMGDLFTTFRFGEVDVRMSKSISHRQAYELGAALGIPVSPGGQVQVSATDLLAALDEKAAA